MGGKYFKKGGFRDFYNSNFLPTNSQGVQMYNLRLYAKWLAILGFAFITIGLFSQMLSATSKVALERELTELENMLSNEASRLEMASAAYKANYQKYPDHYTTGFGEKLEAASQSLGTVESELRLAREAQADQERKVARSHAAIAKNTLKGVDDICNKILGPPALFDELARKTTATSSELEKAGLAIEKVRGQLAAKTEESWNKDHGLSLGTAFNKLSEAEKKLLDAELVLKVKVERGLIDTPLAYDLAIEAKTLSSEALKLAEADEANARKAETGLNNAVVCIQNATAYVQLSSYQQDEGLARLQTALNTLEQAKKLFWEESFASSLEHAEMVCSLCLEAEEIVSTPTPTPEPTSTPVPIVFDDDDDDPIDVYDWNDDDSDPVDDWGDDWSDDDWSDDGWGDDDWSSGGDDGWSDDGWSSDDGW